MDPLTPKSGETPLPADKPSPPKVPAAARPKRTLPKAATPRSTDPKASPLPKPASKPPLPKKVEAPTDPATKTPLKKSKPFLSDSSASEELPVTNTAAPRQGKINPRERTLTIPSLYYQRIRRKFQKRFVFHCTVLAGFVSVLGIALFLSGISKLERSVIVEKVTQALSDLEANRLEDAQTKLEESLFLFSTHQPKPSVRQWSRNPQLYNYMLRAGMAFRSLGDYRKALDTYRQIASRNVKGLNTPLGKDLTDHVKQLVDHERWSPEEIQDIYRYLLDMTPESWSPCDSLLIVATEMAGLKIFPMSERYQNASIITYGKPAPMQTLNDERFRVEGAQYYRVDRLASPIEMEIPPEFTKNDRLRLKWYSECGRECLVFGKDAEGGGVQLLGIEGVLLSDTHTVELFNPLVERDTS